MSDYWYPDGTVFDESGLPVASAPKPHNASGACHGYATTRDDGTLSRPEYHGCGGPAVREERKNWSNDEESKLDEPKRINAFVTKDSGKRMQEITGAKRDTNDGKGRFDLIAPEPLRRLAELYQRGAQKYGDRNWEKGVNLARCIDSALRHINDYQSGDRSEDHLISAAWNLFTFVATEDRIKRGLLPAELNNMPPPHLTMEGA